MANWGEILNIAVPTGVGAGVSIWAANKASGAQKDASDQATALQREIFEWQKANTAPYQQAGEGALNALSYGLGLPAGQNAGGSPSLSYNPFAFAGAPGPGGSGVAGNALSGAGTGFTFGGPVGAGIGAAFGAVSSLFGRGRRQADQLVPYQEALANESKRVGDLIESGQISMYEGGQYMQGLLDQYKTYASDFDRAGPGAIETVDKYLTPTITEWASAAPPDQNALASSGNPQTPGGLTFGEFNAPFEFEASPGYEFRKQEGLDAVNSSASAGAGILRGSTLKALNDYAQNYASNEFQNAFNQFQVDRGNRFNQFATLAGLGNSATQQANALGSNYAAAAGQNALTAGQAQAGGYLGTANAINQGIGQGVNLFQQQQIANSLASPAQRIPTFQNQSQLEYPALGPSPYRRGGVA